MCIHLQATFSVYAYIVCLPSPEFSLEVCEDVGVGEIWEESLATSKLLCSTYILYLKIKGICLLMALKFKALKVYWGEQYLRSQC